jgi:D-amino peptidase
MKALGMALLFGSLAGSLAGFPGPLALAQNSPKPLRVFISVDMEGITGVVNPAQLGPGPGGIEYDRFRRIMTGEVNAAIEGALAAGATAITVADSHGNGLSVIPDELNPKARLIRSWPRPLEMMEGVEQGFDAAFLIGYHASINTPGAVRAHTISSARFFDVRLNGKHASESMISAATAGQFGVPVVMITGDDKAVAEAKLTIDQNLFGVAVKRAIGYHSADNMSPESARNEIRATARRALEALAQFKPYRVAAPVQLEITFKNMINAELLAELPGVERVDGATVRFTGKQMSDVTRFISFVTNYDSTQ